MRWGEIRRFEADVGRISLERRETILPVPRSGAFLVLRRKLWRVLRHTSYGVEVLVGPTADEAGAWSAYRRHSGDRR